MSTVHQKPPKIIPALLIVIGGMFIVFSFLADLLGYGDTGSFGIGQLFLLIVGGDCGTNRSFWQKVYPNLPGHRSCFFEHYFIYPFTGIRGDHPGPYFF